MNTLLKAALACALGAGIVDPSAAVAASMNGGLPDVNLASTFIGSGGGAGSFSTVRAFDRMLGANAMLTQETQLRAMYGQHQTDQFVHMFDYAMADAWTVASRQNVKLPNAPSSSATPALAHELLKAGTGTDGTFRTLLLFDDLFTRPVASQVMNDLNTRYGSGSSSTFLRIANRFFYDVGQNVGTNISLEPNQ